MTVQINTEQVRGSKRINLLPSHHVYADVSDATIKRAKEEITSLMKGRGYIERRYDETAVAFCHEDALFREEPVLLDDVYWRLQDITEGGRITEAVGLHIVIADTRKNVDLDLAISNILDGAENFVPPNIKGDPAGVHTTVYALFPAYK